MDRSSTMKDPEIIFCKVPTNKECGLYLTNIFWNDSSDNLWFHLYHILSEFGLLYNVYVAPTKFGGGSDCFYAFARYYSRNAAKKALSNVHKIGISTGNQNIRIAGLPHNHHKIKKLKLNSSAIRELISYYFGFHYWSSEILYLEKEEGEGCTVKYVCVVRVTTKDGLSSEGVGIGQAPLTRTPTEGRGMAYKMAQKFAIENGQTSAMSKFVIVELPNGKRLLEVDTTQPDPLFIDPSLDDPLIAAVEELEEDPEQEEDATQQFETSEWIENLSDSVLESLLNN